MHKVCAAHLGTSRRPVGKRKQLAVHRGAILPDRSKYRRVTVNRLAHLALDRVQLHAALDLETILARLARSRVGSDANHDTPRAILGNTVVDDLVAGKGCVSVECLYIS